MNRYESLKKMTVEQMADELCRMFQTENEVDICKACPGNKFCRHGHNGLIDYLKGDENDESKC